LRWRPFAWLKDRESRELRLLIGAFLLIAGVWAFAELGDEVLEGDTRAFDERVIHALRRDGAPAVPVGPAWLLAAARDVTSLGGYTIIALVTLAVSGYLLLWRKPGMALLVLAASLGGVGWNLLLKAVFGRARPALVPHLIEVSSASFPSAHAMVAAAVYLSLGFLVARVLDRRRLKGYVLGVAMAAAFAVGASRVYLGVHYPTDVLAGWLAGLIWAFLCGLVALWLQRRGRVEGEGGNEEKGEG
jgi:undecaprenyl-diphosphatase